MERLVVIRVYLFTLLVLLEMDKSLQTNTRRVNTPQRAQGSPNRTPQNRTFAFPSFPRMIAPQPGRTFSNSLTQGGSNNDYIDLKARVDKLETVLNGIGDKVSKIERTLKELDSMLVDLLQQVIKLPSEDTHSEPTAVSTSNPSAKMNPFDEEYLLPEIDGQEFDAFLNQEGAM